MTAGRFEPSCPRCDQKIVAVATTEVAPFAPLSFYALTKQVQEQTALMFARAMGLDAIALRFQNVYGPGQSPSNSYTGILAIFSNLVRQGKAINIFEDGRESRDFVYVDDVVDAILACASTDIQGSISLNVGSGRRTSVLDVANAIVRHFGANVPVNVTGDFRIGDIRHNFADLSQAGSRIGYTPKWSFEDGLLHFLRWIEGFPATEAHFDRSLSELQTKGFMLSGVRNQS